MIAHRTIDAFGDLTDLIENLGQLAPPDALQPLDLGQSDDLLSPQALPPDPAAAAIVAVIDHAIPFAHRLLTTACGHSRVAAIWMQGAPVVMRRPDIPVGQELRGVEIDRLRGAGTPTPRDGDSVYRLLGQLDPARPAGRWLMHDRSHGAAVACTAAGFAPEDTRGLAHPLIGVGLPDWALADTSGAAMPLLMQAAVIYIISRARALSRQLSRVAGRPLRLPLVVNISLGITAGPRDGTSLIEAMQDAISADPPPGLGPVHFVLAAGNAREKRLRAVLPPDQEIGWQLLPDDRTPSELQVWSAPLPPGQSAIRLRLTLPDKRQVTTAFRRPQPGSGQIARIRDAEGRELARLTLQARPGSQGMRQVLTVILPPAVADRPGLVLAPVGIWQIKLMPDSPGACDVLVQRDDRIKGFPRAGQQSRLVDPTYRRWLPDGRRPGHDDEPPISELRRNGTCNAYAWGRQQIRVGAALGPPTRDPPPVSDYSGLLGDGLSGDLLAAGDRGLSTPGMQAPGVRAGAVQHIDGTSIAAPRVTRWLAGKLASGAAIRGRDQVILAARADYPRSGGQPRVDPALPWDRD